MSQLRDLLGCIVDRADDLAELIGDARRRLDALPVAQHNLECTIDAAWPLLCELLQLAGELHDDVLLAIQDLDDEADVP